MSTGTSIMLTAGTLTFGNEWIQTGTPNWRMPIGTLGGMLIIGAIDKVSPIAATGLAAVVLVAALTVRFNGKSVAEEALSVMPNQTNKRTVPAPVKKG